MSQGVLVLKALTVDDEEPARERISRLLRSLPAVEVIGQASDGRKALDEIERLKPDIVLLDIEMPELDGISVATVLSESASGPRVVFMTGFSGDGLDGFEVAGLNYLLKPVSLARLTAMVEKIRAEVSLGARTRVSKETFAEFRTRLGIH